MSDTVVITMRIPQALLDRADALLDLLAEDEEAVFLGRASRSVVLRLAVLRGIEHLEAQHNGKPRGGALPRPTKRVKRTRA